MQERERGLWELFVLSVQFLFKPKTALKYETWGWGEHEESRLILYHSRGSNLGARKTLLKMKVDKYGSGSLSLVGNLA